VLKPCKKKGLIKLEHAALNKTGVMVSASKYKAIGFKGRKLEEACFVAEERCQSGTAVSANRNHGGVPNDKAQPNFTAPESCIMCARADLI